MSKLEKTREAAREAAGVAALQFGQPRAQVAVVFATVDHCQRYPELLAGVRDALPVEHVLGTSGCGVLTISQEIDEGPGLAVMLLEADQPRFLPFLVPNLQEGTEHVAHQLVELLKPQLSTETLLLLFADPFSLQPYALFDALRDRLGPIDVAGGASGEDGHQRQTFQFLDDRICSDAVAGLCLTGQFNYHIGLTQAYHPLGEPLTITRSRGHIIAELDGRPASQVLREFTQPFGIANQQLLLNLMGIGVPLIDVPQQPVRRGQYLVRNLIGVDYISGAIAAAGEFTAHERVFFAVRDAQRAERDFEETLTDLSERIGQPACGFYFNCAGRGAHLYSRPNVDTGLIRQRFGPIPLLGCFTSGEIAPVLGSPHLHSYSGVLVLIA